MTLFKFFQPGCACCGMPLVCISTCDSSVDYAYLCPYEDETGNPENSCYEGWADDDPDGNCVFPPLQSDLDKWNEDLTQWNETRNDYQDSWPIAGGIISGGYRCWAGIDAAIYPTSEDWAQDTYGDFEFAVGGSDYNNRLLLTDLQTMFELLYQKHIDSEELVEHDDFGFLFLIDNTGSITEAQWGNGADIRGQFLEWIESEYPECQIKIVDLDDYLVDGEDWLRHFAEYYEETATEGIS